MEQMALLDAVERYLRGEMAEQEKAGFEELRRSNPEVDQMVVEHHLFLGEVEKYGQRRTIKQQLHQVHNQLLEAQEISETIHETKVASIVQFWSKYKRTIAVAASIAGITALTISSAIHLFTPKANKTYLENLNRKISALETKQNAQNRKIDQLIEEPPSEKMPQGPQVSGGTSFLIDGDGYLVTNYHVVNDATTLVVASKGNEYIAKTIYTDPANDLAVLKISDKDWKPKGNLPYGIRKSTAELGEELFTLGYPRNEIVYNRGYLSASSGYNNDSLSIQLSISANPGNSGGPVLDKNGNIIGILSTRDRQANDVVFATKAININRAIEELRKDTAFRNLTVPGTYNTRSLDRVDQIKKLQDCVFMVKVY